MKLFPAILAFAAAVACGGGGTTSPATVDPAVGHYALQSVGGKPLPALVSQTSTQTTTITFGSMDIHSSGTVVFSYDETISTSGTSSVRTNNAQGTWARSANVLEFQNVVLNGGVTITVNVAESAGGITLSGQAFNEVGGDFFYQKTK